MPVVHFSGVGQSLCDSNLDMIEISADQVSTFTHDGAVCLRGLFKKEWLEDLTLGLEKNVAEP